MISRAEAAKIFRGGGKPAIAVERRRVRAPFGLDAPDRAEAEKVVLVLSMPPSSNNLFANASDGGRVKSEAYTDWIRSGGWLLLSQRPGRVAGRYRILLEVERPKNKRRVDLGNLEKAISDLCVTHRIVQDDALAEEISLRWSDEIKGVRVTISRWEAHAA